MPVFGLVLKIILLAEHAREIHTRNSTVKTFLCQVCNYRCRILLKMRQNFLQSSFYLKIL